MYKKKKAKKLSAMPPATGSSLDQINVDARPEESPYASSITHLQLPDGTSFAVPLTILYVKCPKLHVESLWNPPVSLETTTNVAHVLVHYIFTDTYQCLKPIESSLDDRLATELKTSLGAYDLARKYDLVPLQELARNEIERLRNELPFPKVIELVRSAYPNPAADDAWFIDFMRSGLQSMLEEPSHISDCCVPGPEGGAWAVSELLFNTLIEVVRDRVSRTEEDLDTELEKNAPADDCVVEEPSPVTAAPLARLPPETTPLVDDSEPLPAPDAPSPSWDYIQPANIPEPEPEPEPAAEPEPEPVVGVPPEPPEEPEPVPAREDDSEFWANFPSSKKKKKKLKREALH